MPVKLQASLGLPKSHEYARFSVINTRLCFGITFFLVQDSVVATHAHTKRERDARRVFENLPPWQQAAASFTYVPLPAKEEVLEYGLRYSLDENGDPQGRPMILVCVFLCFPVCLMMGVADMCNSSFT